MWEWEDEDDEEEDEDEDDDEKDDEDEDEDEDEDDDDDEEDDDDDEISFFSPSFSPSLSLLSSSSPHFAISISTFNLCLANTLPRTILPIAVRILFWELQISKSKTTDDGISYLSMQKPKS